MTSSNHGFRVLENEWIDLPDGTRLAARIWLPDDTYSAPVPAIFEYLPYKKRGGTDARDDSTYPYFAVHGYAGVRVDMRGNGESDGLMHDEYTQQELDDGVNVIAWITRQPWCDGNVGMIGISWGGFNGLQIAALRPPALKTIITVCSTDGRYSDDIHYMGGCLLNDNLTWSGQMLNLSSRPPDPQLVGENWRKLWLERLEAMPILAANWLQHQCRDDFWKHGSVCEDFSAIEVPVLAVGGWNDAYSNAVFRMLQGLKSPVRGIVGPWEHKYPNLAGVGPAVDFLHECVRWWDCWLKGEQNGVHTDPVLRAYLLKNSTPSAGVGHRAGVWVGEAEWPSPKSEPRTLYITNNGLEYTPGLTEPLEVSSPQDLGAMSGNFCPGMRVDNELPGDQRWDDEKSITFDTAPLGEDLAILGAPELEFEFTCSTEQAFLVARLCDVSQEEASTRVSLCALNLTHLSSHEAPEALVPGQTYKAKIKLNDAGHIFANGRRIRLAISTSYWPLVWPSAQQATVSILPGSAKLILPVLPLDSIETVDFAAAPNDSPNQFDVARPPRDNREVSQSGDGTSVIALFDDLGRVRNRANGLETESTVRNTYRIKPNDPLSAETETAWTFETRRGDWHVSTRSSTTMRADNSNFYLTAQLEAFEGEILAFSRTWHETIERDHV